MALPAWSPTLTQIAAYIPTRTRDQATPGSDTLTGTFTANTTPTDTTVNAVFIPAAVAEVAAAAGPVPESLNDLASEAAALRGAADIELSYPDRDADVDVYRDLNDRAIAALGRLLQAMADAGIPGGDALLPVWFMPEPARYGDTEL